MSIKLMAKIWERTDLSQSETLLALALADHADESGHCWPSLSRLAEKARVTERSARRILRSLEGKKVVKTVFGGTGPQDTNHYFLTPDKGDIVSPIAETRGTPVSGVRGTLSAEKGGHQCPGNHHKNHHIEPSGLHRPSWERFVQYRKRIKKPIREASIEAAMKNLASFGDDQAAVVEQTIANSWQGLFALKNRKASNAGNRKLSVVERVNQATGGARF